MSATNLKSAHKTGSKPKWTRPRLHELGNLRDFVRAGNLGKAGVGMDGMSASEEAMINRG